MKNISIHWICWIKINPAVVKIEKSKQRFVRLAGLERFEIYMFFKIHKHYKNNGVKFSKIQKKNYTFHAYKDFILHFVGNKQGNYFRRD